MRKSRSLVKHFYETAKHKAWVAYYLGGFVKELLVRAVLHDLSKFMPDEADGFARILRVLEAVPYGSPMYKEALKSPCIELHYRRNSHHPEHYYFKPVKRWFFGLQGMSLVDVVEMYCDWRAAIRRSPNGDLHKSLDINAQRFDSDERITVFETLRRQAEYDTRNDIKAQLETLLKLLDPSALLEQFVRDNMEDRSSEFIEIRDDRKPGDVPPGKLDMRRNVLENDGCCNIPLDEARQQIEERYKDYETMEWAPELSGPYSDDPEVEAAVNYCDGCGAKTFEKDAHRVTGDAHRVTGDVDIWSAHPVTLCSACYELWKERNGVEDED